MRSKKSILKEVNELTQGRGWLVVARMFGMAALAIALDFRDMYRIKNCPTLKVRD